MKKMKLALFDLDDTLFDGDTEAEWTKFMDTNGFIKDPSFFIKMEEFTNNYRGGKLDVDEYSEFLLSPLIGKSLKDLKNDIERFTQETVDKFTDALSQELLDKHKNDLRVLTSGSLSFLVKEIGLKLGINVNFGTDPEYVDGKFTGKVLGRPNFSEEKVRRVEEWANGQEFEEIYAYSDSIHDLPLLEFSHVPYAISPDASLREVAVKKKWAIIDR